jgi:hypothetical protein
MAIPHLTKSLTEKNLKVEVVEFSEEYKPELIIFCNKCKKLGFTLNESLKAMKLRDSNVKFWLIFVNGEIASVSGCQKLYASNATSIVKDGDFRLYFRSAVLPKYYNTIPLSKYAGHNLYVKYLTIPQIRWAKSLGAKRLFLTGVTTPQGSPHMDKVARITRFNEAKYCKRRGIPPIWTELGTSHLFHTDQIIFKVNEENLQWWIDKGGFVDGNN